MTSIIPDRTPVLVKKLFPQLTWEVRTTEKEIYLTFDDGPTPGVTDWTLDCLNEYKAKATFFCVGSQVEKNNALFKRILDEGHRVGNHTHNHIKGWSTTNAQYLENIELASQHIDSSLFRPPYGKMTPKQVDSVMAAKYRIVMWSVLSKDWKQELSKEDCLRNVTAKSSSGDIIVFHDSEKAKKNMTYALPRFLESFSEKGFEFKCIPGSIR